MPPPKKQEISCRNFEILKHPEFVSRNSYKEQAHTYRLTQAKNSCRNDTESLKPNAGCLIVCIVYKRDNRREKRLKVDKH